MRRKDREMSPEFGYEVADGTLFGVLSLIDPEGNPYGVPVSLVREGESFYFHCANEGFKLDCLRKNPHVCITCVGDVTLVPEQFSANYSSAIFRGMAQEVRKIEEKKKVLTLIVDRYAPSNIANMGGEVSGEMPNTSIWKIVVHDVTAKAKK
ncbi:MAG: pyridoxamine 5'-phosphate oxidase family protein [Eubacteriales bacterium]